MDILWHGHSCFTIKTKTGTAVINPYQPEIGLKLPNLKAEVVLQSDESAACNNAAAVSGTPKILNWAGEYEVAGIAITAQELILPEEKGAKAPRKSMLFTLDAENLKVCYLSDLSISLTEELTESIGEVDVLIVPVSGEKAGYKEAHEIIEELEPRAVIPMRYKTPGLKGELESLDNFAKQAGITSATAKDKFSLSDKSDLPQDKTEFVILNPQIA